MSALTDKRLANSPVTLLDNEADRLRQPEVHYGKITHPNEWTHAANMLSCYEDDHGVLFVPLSVEVLDKTRAIITAYDALGATDKQAPDVAVVLVGVVRDLLLGLES
jgi:hypothetical protein